MSSKERAERVRERLFRRLHPGCYRVGQRTSILDLCDDVLSEIFKRVVHVYACSLTCRRFRKVALAVVVEARSEDALLRERGTDVDTQHASAASPLRGACVFGDTDIYTLFWRPNLLSPTTVARLTWTFCVPRNDLSFAM
jgi:hypothetical protein